MSSLREAVLTPPGVFCVILCYYVGNGYKRLNNIKNLALLLQKSSFYVLLYKASLKMPLSNDWWKGSIISSCYSPITKTAFFIYIDKKWYICILKTHSAFCWKYLFLPVNVRDRCLSMIGRVCQICCIVYRKTGYIWIQTVRILNSFSAFCCWCRLSIQAWLNLSSEGRSPTPMKAK